MLRRSLLATAIGILTAGPVYPEPVIPPAPPIFVPPAAPFFEPVAPRAAPQRAGFIHGSSASPPPPTCAYPVDGGCAAAAAGLIRQSSFGTYARQNGQSWAGGNHPWNWNSCGVDYGCGAYGPFHRADQINTYVPACTYAPLGNSGGNGPLITCAGGANLTIQDIDFSDTGSGPGTNCVPLILNNPQTGTLTLKDVRFKNGPNCTGNNTGPGVGPMLVRALDGGSSANLDLENITVDGDMYNQASSPGGCLYFSIYGSVTIRYSAFLRCDGRPITIASGSTASTFLLTNYNYIEDMNYTTFNGWHGEFVLETSTGPNMASFTSSYDTALNGHNVATGSNGTTAFINPTPGVFSTKFATVQIDHLVAVTNYNPAAPGGQTVTTSQAAWFGGFYGTITISNNYVDHTGTYGSSFGTGGGYCDSPTTFTSNTDLVSGGAINTWGSIPVGAINNGVYNSGNGSTTLSLNAGAYPILNGGKILLASMAGTGSVASLNGTQTTGTNYTNQINANGGSYNSSTGAASVTLVSAPGGLVPGVMFQLVGMTGTGAVSSLNGYWTVTSVSSNTVNFTATTGLGTITITAGQFYNELINFTGPTGLTLTITGGSVNTNC